MNVLKTNRLIIRKFCMEDLDDFYEYAKDPDVGPNAGWKPHDNKQESAIILKSFIDEDVDEVFAIVHQADNKIIGSIGIHKDSKRVVNGVRSMGYVLSSAYWGQGIMTEAATAIMTYSFEVLQLELLCIYHYPFNKRSKRVIEKLGFNYEGTIRKAAQIYSGEIYDDACYSLTKEEWLCLTSR